MNIRLIEAGIVLPNLYPPVVEVNGPRQLRFICVVQRVAYFSAFGVGGMILEGLHFGELVEKDPAMECTTLTEAVRPILHLLFILIQTYTIFINAKVA